MSTATEIQIMHSMASRKVEAIADRINCAMDNLTMSLYGRQVCARRASKIRKRGDNVRYIGATKTGKARYAWMPALNISREEL